MKNSQGDILNLIFSQSKDLSEKFQFGGEKPNAQFVTLIYFVT